MHNVLTHFSTYVTASYACSPAHGSFLVCDILTSPELYNQWTTELRELVASLAETRQTFFNHLMDLVPEMDWSPVLSQKGMCLFLGLTTKQVNYIQGFLL